MNSALRLLRDVEQQVKQSVGSAPETPITDLDEQQLRAVPQALLTKLSVSLLGLHIMQQKLVQHLCCIGQSLLPGWLPRLMKLR